MGKAKSRILKDRYPPVKKFTGSNVQSVFADNINYNRFPFGSAAGRPDYPTNMGFMA